MQNLPTTYCSIGRWTDPVRDRGEKGDDAESRLANAAIVTESVARLKDDQEMYSEDILMGAQDLRRVGLVFGRH
jgi:hypothetical protein